MKKYTKINVTITKFDIEDILTASGAIMDSSTLTGKDADMYDIYVQSSEAKNTNVSIFTW